VKVSVLIPWRTDNGARERVWSHCERLWNVLPYELVIGTDSHEGPFCPARAFNDAARKATGEVFVLYGADHLPDQSRVDWAAKQLETNQWCGLYSSTVHYSQTSTNAILSGWHPDRVPPAEFETVHPFCIAVIGIRADAWIPFDERFTGWGSEDTAWRLALSSLYGPTVEPPTEPLRALWHPPAPKDHAEDNYQLLQEYVDAANGKRMREHLEAVNVL